jgi:hypothetical protein
MSYLFLAVPNFCGSTLLHSLLETCYEIVPLSPTEDTRRHMEQGFVECDLCALPGYTNLFGPHSIEANMEHVYADPKNYDWLYIRRCWEENWANTNPYATIKMQKTPADIFRIPQIVPHFPDLKWIIMVRNPYNHVESIMRKATFQMEPLRQLDQICFHATRCLEVQKWNQKFLGDQAYTMTYEDFCARPDFHRQQLGRFMPGLQHMQFEGDIWVKGKPMGQLHDDSAVKLQKLIDKIPDIIDKINEFFVPHEQILRTWGYSLM